MNWMFEPWSWFVSGPLIAATMFGLLILGKQFGMSSSLRTMCSAAGAGKAADFFNYDWRKERWNLMVILGAMLGGFLASEYFTDYSLAISPKVVHQLAQEYQITNAGVHYLPPELFALKNLSQPKTIGILLVGGILVGFGARYAGGCTSGHAISGLSNLQLPSLIAVIGFFTGGLIMIHFIYPFIF